MVSSASVVMGGEIYPPTGGCEALAGWEARGRATSVARMDHTSGTDDFTANIELLLRESDREDPILPEIREADQAPEEEIDSLILAGLVFP